MSNHLKLNSKQRSQVAFDNGNNNQYYWISVNTRGGEVELESVTFNPWPIGRRHRGHWARLIGTNQTGAVNSHPFDDCIEFFSLRLGLIGSRDTMAPNSDADKGLFSNFHLIFLWFWMGRIKYE